MGNDLLGFLIGGGLILRYEVDYWRHLNGCDCSFNPRNAEVSQKLVLYDPTQQCFQVDRNVGGVNFEKDTQNKPGLSGKITYHRFRVTRSLTISQ